MEDATIKTIDNIIHFQKELNCMLELIVFRMKHEITEWSFNETADTADRNHYQIKIKNDNELVFYDGHDECVVIHAPNIVEKLKPYFKVIPALRMMGFKIERRQDGDMGQN